MNNSSPYTYINAAATTQVETGKSTLTRVVVNGTLAGDVTVQDSDGTTSNTVAVIKSGTLAGHIDYNTVMSRGVVIITAGADDITIVSNNN